MNSRYDSYRPDTEPLGEVTRRPTVRNGRRDSMFWRREQPSERRGRRHSNEVNPTSNSNHSPVNSIISTSPKRSSGRVRSRSTAAPERLNTNLSRNNTNIGSRRSSMSIQQSPISASSNGLHLPTREALQETDPSTNTMRSPRAINPHHVAATMDPRLKNQRSVAGKDLVQSPITQSGEENSGSEGYGFLFKVMVSTVTEHNEARKEADVFSKKIENLMQNLQSAQKMFPNGNSYIEKLQHDIETMQKNQEAQKVHLRKTERDMENAAQAITGYDSRNALSTDVFQTLKSHQQEQEKESKKREEDLRMQVFRLAETVDIMKVEMKRERADWKDQLHQMKSESITAIKTKIDSLQTLVNDSSLSNENLSPFLVEDRKRLAQYETDLKGIQNNDLRSLRSDLRDQSNDLESLRSDIKAQKLSIARFNDVFASQESLKSLDARMDQLKDGIPPSDQIRLPPKDYVTQKQLNEYVTVFNKFESKIDHQFSSRDIVSQSLKDDIATQTQRTNALQGTVNESEERLKSLIDQQSAKLSTLEEATKSMNTSKANEPTSDQSTKLLNQLLAINSRIDSLETVVQNSQQMFFDHNSHHKAHTQQINNFHGLIRGLDEKSKANSHSIASLNQRFDNITTDQLSRQMAGVIEPMLVNIRPQIQELSAQLPQIKMLQETLQATRKSVGDNLLASTQMMQQLRNNIERIEKGGNEAKTRLSSLEEGSKRMSQQLLDLDGLAESVQNVKTDIFSVRARAHEAINESAAEIRKAIETLEESTGVKIAESHTDVRKNTLDAVEKFREEQSASSASLLEEVKEARNSIDARLAIVEIEMKSRRDKDNALATSKSSSAQKRLGGTSGATPVQSPTSKGRVSPASSSSKTNSTTNKEGNTHGAYGLKPPESSNKGSKIPSLAKHFVPTSDGDSDGDDDDDGDAEADNADGMEHTIVVNLPTNSKAATNAYDRAEVISISESDSNTEDPLSSEKPRMKLDGEHYITLKQPAININKWTKRSTNDRSQSNISASKVTETPVAKKRKRDRSQTSSRGGRHGAGSNNTTPSSSQTKKKKKS